MKSVYQGTSDPAVRKTLTRAAIYGLGCVPVGLKPEEDKTESSRFFRDLAALDRLGPRGSQCISARCDGGTDSSNADHEIAVKRSS